MLPGKRASVSRPVSPNTLTRSLRSRARGGSRLTLQIPHDAAGPRCWLPRLQSYRLSAMRRCRLTYAVLSWRTPSRCKSTPVLHFGSDVRFLRPRILLCQFLGPALTNLPAHVQNLENVHLNSEKVAEAELHSFRQAGGVLVVDTTVASLGRNPKALWRLSRATDVSVVMGTGFGVHASHPPWLAAESQESVAAMMERELSGGSIESDEHARLRAGVIGGIGISLVPHDNELKVLKAATTVGVCVLTFPRECSNAFLACHASTYR